MTWRISSRWIQFNDFNFNSTRIFEYSYHSNNSVHITAQICTQLGHCSDVSVRSIQLNLNSKIVHFQMVKRPQTQLFRLEFIIENYRSYCQSSSRLEGSLRLNHGFGDPCQTELFKCQNNGRCLSDPNNSSAFCDCPEGFYGDRCENKDFCIHQEYRKKCPDKSKSGCINTKNGATCLCLKNDMVIWDDKKER